MSDNQSDNSADWGHSSPPATKVTPPLETYVYEQTEVRKTGRLAHRKLTSGKLDVKHEITPVDSSIGTWKKWVGDQDLLVVRGDNNNEKQD